MISKDTLDNVIRMAIDDESLHRALRAWYLKDSKIKNAASEMTFHEWLCNAIEHASNQIKKWYTGPTYFPPSEDVACALRVNAEGDFLALYQENSLKGCLHDVNCYVEEGCVCSNVWMRCQYRDEAWDSSNEMANSFRRLGYSAEVLIDEADHKEATVCALIDFPEYMDMARSGISAEALFTNAARNASIPTVDMNANEKSIADRIRDLISTSLSVDRKRVFYSASIEEDLGADELDFVELVMELEEEFDICIPQDDERLLGTVGGVIDYVEKRLNDENSEKKTKA